MACEHHKLEKFELPHLKDAVKPATYISPYWKLTRKLKLEEHWHLDKEHWKFDLCLTYHVR